MIISRTPYRISFFGGGTDFSQWYRENGGAVISTSIDKYNYLNCRVLPPFFDHKHRLVYSRQENVQDIEEIQHASIRETIKFLNLNHIGFSIHHDGDLPARSGIGSSSSFTVGLLHCLYALKGQMVTKRKLALDAIYIEQELIKEAVGSQDQTIAAFGGFNKIEFGGLSEIEVEPISIGKERIEEFHSHLLLFFTRIHRTASSIEEKKIKNFNKKKADLKTIQSFVYESINILNSKSDLNDFGKLLMESWKLKKSLSEEVSNGLIDDIYEVGIGNGAIGGKILGAGNGGFILFFAKPENHKKIKDALSRLIYVPFRFDITGSQIIYYGGDSI
jgi:D-glycero-alpha-D-manno-heptose-7-phosphate kinase